MTYLCTAFPLLKMSDQQKGSQKKIFEKVSKKFGGFKNLSYLCTRFPLLKMKLKVNKKMVL